jgi:hypothetical protein
MKWLTSLAAVGEAVFMAAVLLCSNHGSVVVQNGLVVKGVAKNKWAVAD